MPALFAFLHRMLATQKVAPNSPQWFNTGLHWAYGIDGPSQGHMHQKWLPGKIQSLEFLGATCAEMTKLIRHQGSVACR